MTEKTDAIRREFGLSRPHLLRPGKDPRRSPSGCAPRSARNSRSRSKSSATRRADRIRSANALVIFKPEEFEHVVPYLMLNRDGLDVLVHPLTTDAVEDHSSYAIWLGNPVELKLHTLPHGRGGQLPSGVSA